MSRSESLTEKGGEVFDLPPGEDRRSTIERYEEERLFGMRERQTRQVYARLGRELRESGAMEESDQERIERETLEIHRQRADEEAQQGSVQIFENVRTKASADPALRKVDSGDIYLLCKDIQMDSDKIRVVIALVGDSTPEKAEKVRIIPVGLKSYLEVNNKGGETKETVNHQTISFPATMHDVGLYQLIADAMD